MFGYCFIKKINAQYETLENAQYETLENALTNNADNKLVCSAIDTNK